MKKIKFFALLALCATAMAMVGCDEPNTPDGPIEPTAEELLKDASLRLKVTATNIEDATVQINFNVVNELAYQVVQADLTAEYKDVPTAEDIFANGTPIELTEGQSVVRLNVTDLEPDSGYIVFVAGRLVVEDKTYVFPEVAKVTLMTYAQPTMSAEVVSVGTTAAKFAITSARISRFAYLVYLASEAPEEIPSADIIFATGRSADVTEAKEVITVNALMPNKDYVIYIAGEVAELEEYFEEVLVLDGIKTQDFSESFKIHSIDHASFKVDIRLPDSISELNHILKWGMWDLYVFNLNHKFGRTGRPESWAQSINLHESAYNNQIKESCTMTFDNNTAWVLGPDGKPFYDEEYGTYLQMHSIMVPGQPNILMMGEYQYGDHRVYANFTDGWYQPLFLEDDYMAAWDADYNVASNQVPWWYGFAVQETVTNTQPEPFNGTVKFERILSEDNNNTKAKVRFTPSEEVEQYCVFIITEGMRQQLLPMLNNDEKLMQWFVTSNSGFNEGAISLTGPKEMYLGEDYYGTEEGSFSFVNGALTDTKNIFYAYITAMGGGDKDGDGICDATLQTFERHEFKLGERKLRDAVVDITVLESTPDKVRYHVKKAENSAQVKQAYYIANYEREWLGAGYTPEQLLDYYGNPLSSADVAMINSADGLIVEIPSRPNAINYFQMKVYNGESYHTYSETIKAVSAVTDPANKIESNYFTSLDGDWTAKATILYKAVVDEDTGEIQALTADKTSKVTIGAQTYPETLPQSVYDTYAQFGISKEATDNYYAEFTDAVDRHNEDVRNRNQVTCAGWSFDLTGEAKDTYMDPFSLFSSSTYNGWSSTSPLYDFGPKWYIEFDAEGNAWVPFNVNRYIPMSSWTTTNTGWGEYVNEYHMIAYDPTTPAMFPYLWDEEGVVYDGKFPVEISADGNTITIKPVVIGEKNFYPNMGSVQNETYTEFAVASSIISDIVLTRGYTAEAQQQKVAGKKQSVTNNHKVSPVKRTMPLTNFTTPVTMHEQVEPYKIRSVEEWEATARERVQSGFYNR